MNRAKAIYLSAQLFTSRLMSNSLVTHLMRYHLPSPICHGGHTCAASGRTATSTGRRNSAQLSKPGYTDLRACSTVCNYNCGYQFLLQIG